MTKDAFTEIMREVAKWPQVKHIDVMTHTHGTTITFEIENQEKVEQFHE